MHALWQDVRYGLRMLRNPWIIGTAFISLIAVALVAVCVPTRQALRCE